jgi:hypothetical protein
VLPCTASYAVYRKSDLGHSDKRSMDVRSGRMRGQVFRAAERGKPPEVVVT